MTSSGNKAHSKTTKEWVSVPPATHRVVTNGFGEENLFSFSNTNIQLSDTPKRGELLGIVRPVWQKVVESECRLAWLHEMEENKLVVKNIESYAISLSACLRTEEMIEREEERIVLLGLTKVKIKDEKKTARDCEKVERDGEEVVKEVNWEI